MGQTLLHPAPVEHNNLGEMPELTLSLSQLSDDDLALLLTIRHFELALLDLFSQGKLNGTTHTCLGQEYIPVALRPLLTPHDFLFSNHRGHGHYIARFQDPAGLLAEIMGRSGAICNGVGGSQHIYRQGYLSTGVQGEGIAVATGVALHLKRAGTGGMAVIYIGDGTWGEGSVYEALNIAQLWQLPLLVVVEHNGIAQATSTRLEMAGSIEGRARAFGIDYCHVTARDINQIRREVEPQMTAARAQQHPLIIECTTTRLGPHSKGDDTRSAEEMAVVQARDWYPNYRNQFPAQFEQIEEAVQAEIEEMVREVEARPLAQWRP